MKLLYPQESDSINEAYLWNQQSGKSYQGQAGQRGEVRGEGWAEVGESCLAASLTNPPWRTSSDAWKPIGMLGTAEPK